jgi:hypothetical protein
VKLSVLIFVPHKLLFGLKYISIKDFPHAKATEIQKQTTNSDGANLGTTQENVNMCLRAETTDRRF